MADNLILPASKTREIWKHFGFEKDNDSGEPKNINYPKCRHCLKKVSASGGNTSNLHTHLKKNHPSIAAALGPAGQAGSSAGAHAAASGSSSATSATQLCLEGSFALGVPYERDTRRWKECTDKVTRYIAKGMLPFRTVEKPEFKAMCHTLDRRYVLPDRKYISNVAIPELYLKVRQEVQAALKESQQQFFSLTTDMWSSVNMSPYMALTVHIINKDWKLVSLCLQTSFFPDDHTAENLANALQEQLADWNLDPKYLSAVTTDNGANILAAITKVLCWPWLNCFGHNLHLAVNNTISDKKHSKAIDNTMERCRTTVGQFSHSWKRKRSMGEAQEDLKLPDHKLVTVSYKVLIKQTNGCLIAS